MPVGTLKSAIVPGTLVASVEPLGTVVSGQTPFRYKGPVGRLSQVLARLTSVLKVLTPAALKLGNREDLVDMVVESNVGSLRVVENAIPVGACESKHTCLAMDVRKRKMEMKHSLGWKASA